MKKRLIHHLDYPEDVDKELIPLLDTINSIPGVRTRYSCCGHGNMEFYLMLSVSCDEAANALSIKFSKMGISVEYDGIHFNNPYTAPYECDFRVGSWKIGTSSPAKRKRIFGNMVKSLNELVPKNDW